MCDHSNESYRAVLSIMLYKVILTLKAIGQCFHVLLFIILCKVVLTVTPVDESLMCDHSS